MTSAVDVKPTVTSADALLAFLMQEPDLDKQISSYLVVSLCVSAGGSVTSVRTNFDLFIYIETVITGLKVKQESHSGDSDRSGDIYI